MAPLLQHAAGAAAGPSPADVGLARHQFLRTQVGQARLAAARSLRSLAPQGDGDGLVLGSTKNSDNMDVETRCRGALRPGFAKFLLVAPPARGAERRKALVRNAAPVAALRLGQSLHRKGLPVHDADRRALRRSTTVFARPWPHSLSGRAFLPGLLTCSPGSPAGSLRTGHLVPVGRGPRRPGSPVVSRTRRQTVPASPSGNHPDGAPQQAG